MRLLGLVAFLGLAGCGSGELDRPIKIVLPNDYQGEFRIVKDQNGTPYTLTPGYYVFTVPKSGEFRTPNIGPFFKWHRDRFEYVDGRVLDRSGGFEIKDGGTTAGNRQTGPGSSEGSTDFDGTTMRWTVVRIPNSSNKPQPSPPTDSGRGRAVN